MLQNDDTLDRYGRLFAKFLVSLLRSAFGNNVCEYRFPLTEIQRTAGYELYRCAVGKEECLESLVHCFALTVFRAPPVQLLLEKWKCPLMCFLAVDNMQESGSFNEAHHVTTSLAQFKYMIRNVAFYEAYLRAEIHDTGLLG